MSLENIVIKIDAIDNASKKINALGKTMNLFSKSMTKDLSMFPGAIDPVISGLAKVGASFKLTATSKIPLLNRALARSGISMKEFTKWAGKNAMAIRSNGFVVDRVTGQYMTYGRAVKNATLQGRRFKFEWLGIMFAGMALSRVFGGLVRAQLQLFGVTDMLSAMWTIVLLPIMELITPILFKLIEAFMAMPDSMKLVVGVGVLLAAAIGLILMVVGQVMLGVTALAGVFGTSLTGMITASAAFISGALLPIIAVIAIVGLVIAGIYLAWKSNFLNIRRNISGFVAAFKQWFGGLVSIVKGVLNIIKGIFTGDFELVKKGVVQVFSGLFNWIVGGWKMVGQAIIIIFKGVVKLIWNIFKVLVDGIIWAVNGISKVFGGKQIGFKMPSYQTGGIVPETGPALLHKGEEVIPRRQVGNREGDIITFAPTININNPTLEKDMDIRKLADEVNKRLAPEFERMMKGRGSI